jgi:hypothetical protein
MKKVKTKEEIKYEIEKHKFEKIKSKVISELESKNLEKPDLSYLNIMNLLYRSKSNQLNCDPLNLDPNFLNKLNWVVLEWIKFGGNAISPVEYDFIHHYQKYISTEIKRVMISTFWGYEILASSKDRLP